MADGRKRRKQGARAMAVCAAAVGIALAASAAASVRSSTTPVPAGTQMFATVSCPSGQHVKGFGLSGDFDEGSGHSDLPIELALTSPRQVIAGARNVNVDDGSFDTRARCGHADGLSSVATGIDMAADEQASAKAKCPRGTALRLGGFRQQLDPEGSDSAFVMTNGMERTSKRTWKVSAVNVGTAAGRLTAFAYCGAPVHHVHSVERTRNVQSGHYGTATARCPRGSKFVMGGLRVQHYPTYQGDIYITAMGPAGRRGWSVTGFKFQPTFGHLTAIAYCRG